METLTMEKPTSTTHYWGYRELTADELQKVGGGDGDGDGAADGTGTGGDGDSGATGAEGDEGGEAAPQGCMAADFGYSAPASASISDSQGLSLANAVAAITGGPVSASVGFAGNISSGVVGPPSSPSPSPSAPSTGGGMANPGYGSPMGDPGPNFGAP